MKKGIIIFALFYISCGLIIAQSDYRLIQPLITETKERTTFKFDNKELTSFCDTTFSTRYLISNYLKTTNKNRIIDSTGCSPYEIQLITYKSDNFSDYVIIWKVEQEFYSNINLYYVVDNKIWKICNLPIQKVCDNCDEYSYPVDKIVINGDKTEIKISFLQQIKYEINDNNWQIFQPDKLVLSFDKLNKKMNNRH